MSHRDTDNPLEALSDAMAFNSRDFSEGQFEAWIWGIVHGWDNEDNDPDCGDAMAEVAAKVGWNEHHVARLRRLRSNFRSLEAVAPDLLGAREIAARALSALRTVWTSRRGWQDESDESHARIAELEVVQHALIGQLRDSRARITALKAAVAGLRDTGVKGNSE